MEGFILIGGKSSRMGTDKFALRLNGQTFLERTIETLQKAGVEKISVSLNRPELFVPTNDLTVIRDIYQNRGALSGIHSALTYSKSDVSLILACDYPFVSVELVRFLINIAGTENEFDAVAPIQMDGKIQPLCAVYKTETGRQILTEMLENEARKYSVRDFLNRIRTRYLEFTEIAHLPNAENFFFNVNTPADFELAKSLLTKTTKDIYC